MICFVKNTKRYRITANLSELPVFNGQELLRSSVSSHKGLPTGIEGRVRRVEQGCGVVPTGDGPCLLGRPEDRGPAVRAVREVMRRQTYPGRVQLLKRCLSRKSQKQVFYLYCASFPYLGVDLARSGTPASLCSLQRLRRRNTRY